MSVAYLKIKDITPNRCVYHIINRETNKGVEFILSKTELSALINDLEMDFISDKINYTLLPHSAYDIFFRTL